MLAALVLFVAAVGVTTGLLFGFVIGDKRTRDALNLARYRDAMALADDLLKTPDALDLRDRAAKIVAAHKAAFPHKEY